MTLVFTSRVKQAKSGMDAAFHRAAEIIGGMAESYAKGLCPVDTGLLRNSITHGEAGGPTSISSYHDDNGTTHGEYEGNIPKDTSGAKYVVVIGTNVKYAPYQELGAPNAHVPAHPFLRPAIENHLSEYKVVLESELKKG